MGVRLRVNFPFSPSWRSLIFFSFLSMAARERDKLLLLSAMLGSKDVMAMFDFFLVTLICCYYSVSLNVADSRVATSTKSKPQSSVVKWEWRANNQMSVVLWLTTRVVGWYSPLKISWFEPSSTVKVEPVRRCSQGSRRKAWGKRCRLARKLPYYNECIWKSSRMLGCEEYLPAEQPELDFLHDRSKEEC